MGSNSSVAQTRAGEKTRAWRGHVPAAHAFRPSAVFSSLVECAVCLCRKGPNGSGHRRNPGWTARRAGRDTHGHPRGGTRPRWVDPGLDAGRGAALYPGRNEAQPAWSAVQDRGRGDRAGEELLSGLSGTSITSTIAIPNRAIVLGISTRTVTAITGAISYDCGISGETSKFGGSPGIATGSTNVGVIGPQAFYSATPIVLTAQGGNFTGGAVRTAIHYLLPVAPQS